MFQIQIYKTTNDAYIVEWYCTCGQRNTEAYATQEEAFNYAKEVFAEAKITDKHVHNHDPNDAVSILKQAGVLR